MNEKKYCNGCVNCIKVSNLNSDVVEWKCEKGYPKSEMNGYGLIYKFDFSHDFHDCELYNCEDWDNGSYKGIDAVEFGDKIVCNHNVKRKQKAWDFYEGCWRK
jgi:hypothetical protein